MPTRSEAWRRGATVAAAVGLVASLWGPLALQVASAAPAGEGAAAYGFHGEYVDAERGLVDLGQRWYDPRHQVFYSTDPAPGDDSSSLVGDPRLTSSYTLNHHNSHRYTDPDGRLPMDGSDASDESSDASGQESSHESSDDSGYDADSDDDDHTTTAAVTFGTTTTTTSTATGGITGGGENSSSSRRAPLPWRLWLCECEAYNDPGDDRPWWWTQSRNDHKKYLGHGGEDNPALRAWAWQRSRTALTLAWMAGVAPGDAIPLLRSLSMGGLLALRDQAEAMQGRQNAEPN